MQCNAIRFNSIQFICLLMLIFYLFFFFACVCMCESVSIALGFNSNCFSPCQIYTKDKVTHPHLYKTQTILTMMISILTHNIVMCPIPISANLFSFSFISILSSLSHSYTPKSAHTYTHTRSAFSITIGIGTRVQINSLDKIKCTQSLKATKHQN